MSVLFWGIDTTKTTHDATVGLNNIIVANIVTFGARHGAAEAIQSAEKNAWVNRLQAIMIKTQGLHLTIRSINHYQIYRANQPLKSLSSLRRIYID